MKLGKKEPEHVFQGRIVSSQMKWWIDAGTIPLSRLYCIHNVALDRECSECEDSP